MAVRIYIAAPFPEQQHVRDTIVPYLREEGLNIISRWLSGFEELNDENALKDLDDIAHCDVFVAFNPIEWKDAGTGGRHVELGYALALHKPIVIYGERTNIFHKLHHVTVVPYSQSLLVLAQAIRKAK